MQGRIVLAVAAAVAVTSLMLPDGARADRDDARRPFERKPSTATIEARQTIFGRENVDARTGELRRDAVIFSWITNASFAADNAAHIAKLTGATIYASTETCDNMQLDAARLFAGRPSIA